MPEQLGPMLQDEKMDPFVLGAMMADAAPGIEIPSSNVASVLEQDNWTSDLDKSKKKKGLLGPNEKITPDNFASPPPSFTISLDKVKKKETADSNLMGNVNNSKRLVDLNGTEVPLKKNNQNKHVNRRSRAYSWQFVHNVILPKKIPAPVVEEQIQIQARPAVKEIMKLVSETGNESSSAIEEVLREEKRQGTSWREIADETIMELILKSIDAFQFISILTKAYDIQPSDVGLFLATPPDAGTMSLIEEAVCQQMLGLFYDVLKMDTSLLKGVLSCKDTTQQVEKAIFELLSNDEDLRRSLWGTF